MKHDKPPTHYFQVLSRLKSRDFKEWEFNPRDVAELAALVLPRLKSTAASAPLGDAQSLQQTCKSAVRTALEIIRQTLDVVNLEIDPSEPCQAARDFARTRNQQHEARLMTQVIEPLQMQERRAKGLPQDAEVTSVSLDAYLVAVMGKTRDGVEGRRRRYAEYLLQATIQRLRDERATDGEEVTQDELPTIEEARLWVRDTINTQTALLTYDSLMRFHKGYAPKKRQEAARTGGIASAAARKAKSVSRKPSTGSRKK